MVTPGAEYEISVNKWSIKNIESRAEVKKIIGPFSKSAYALLLLLVHQLDVSIDMKTYYSATY